MFQKRFGFLLSLVCAFSLAVTASAAEPAVRTASEASAITKIYNYQPLAAGKIGPISADALICTVTERICDDKGTYYMLADSTPLQDSSLFSTKTDVTSGAGIVRSIKPIADPEEENRSAFRIELGKEYSGQQEVVAFSKIYTAKQDTVLKVKPVQGSSEKILELPIQKGAKITTNCKLILNSDTISVTNYTKAHIKTRLGK